MRAEALQHVGRRLWIRGRVQGVGFRWHLGEEARRLGLSGWVRNRRDGRVEALVCGPQAKVAALILWATGGPPAARVDEVCVEDTAERVQGFLQQPTI